MVTGDSGPVYEMPQNPLCHPSAHLLLLSGNRISSWAQGCQMQVTFSTSLTAGCGHDQLLVEPWVDVQEVDVPPLFSASCWLDVDVVSHFGREQTPRLVEQPHRRSLGANTVCAISSLRPLMLKLSNER